MTEEVSIKNLESFCSGVGPKLTQVLMHVLPIAESTPQR